MILLTPLPFAASPLYDQLGPVSFSDSDLRDFSTS